MPFYEFYCSKCHKILTFFSQKIDTEKQPNCPHCDQITKRQISSFIAAKDIMNPKGDNGGFSNMNDPKTQKLISKISAKAAQMGDDPAASAKLLKEISAIEGTLQNPKLNKLLDQLEKNGNNSELEAEIAAAVSEIETDSESEFNTKSNPKNSLLEPIRDADVYDM